MKRQKQILIFVATHYEEAAFAAISNQLTALQLSITTGGLTSGAVTGCCGGSMMPTHSLSSLLKRASFESDQMPDGVLLTGGVQCVNHLFADPRLHEFLEWAVDLGKMVAVCQPLPYELILSSTIAQSDYLLLQNGESYAQFVDHFVERTIDKRQLQMRQDTMAQVGFSIFE